MGKGMKRDDALRICEISKDQFYYKPKGGKRGRRASRKTKRLVDGEWQVFGNGLVVEHIKEVLADPLADYGYRRMSYELNLSGWHINHKKVYRLMKAAALLQPKREVSSREYVRYRVVAPEEPLRLISMDIKQVWLSGQRRYGFILTILDVFTRVVLDWSVGVQMRQADVQQAWQRVIDNHLMPRQALAWECDIEIRSDNGPQFCAQQLQEFLADNHFKQVFTHPYTPQENGHVESFHAILGRGLQGQDFETLLDLEGHLEHFYDLYNVQRVHGSTCGLPPMTFWHHWQAGNIERQVLDEKARKVRFALKIPRYTITKVVTVDMASQKAGSSQQRSGLDAHCGAKKQSEEAKATV